MFRPIVTTLNVFLLVTLQLSNLSNAQCATATSAGALGDRLAAASTSPSVTTSPGKRECKWDSDNIQATVHCTLSG